MEKHLHIIAFTVPYPVDYGGVFDLFYKLEALQQQGVKIHLHCFDYGRGEQPELNKYCTEVIYYSRLQGHEGISTQFPYIVASRKNETLFSNLLKDDYPIFMEGVHSTYLLNDSRFSHRRCFVRLHNIEHTYYKHLYHSTTLPIKKIYYWWESRQLLKYEKSITHKATFWGVTHADVEAFMALGCEDIDFLPLFLPAWQVNGEPGKGSFCLYHGNLGVAENERAAMWLLEHVFDTLKVPFVIAGKDPSAALHRQAYAQAHTCLVENPSEKEMQDLIRKAHVHVLPSFNATGIKLKVINALYNGRHCVVNEPAVKGSGLETACHIGTTPAELKRIVNALYLQPFSTEDLQMRHTLLDGMFNNANNAQQMVKWIWGE